VRGKVNSAPQKTRRFWEKRESATKKGKQHVSYKRVQASNVKRLDHQSQKGSGEGENFLTQERSLIRITSEDGDRETKFRLVGRRGSEGAIRK